MNHPNLADIKSCTGCMACVDSCAKQAITCVINEEGHYFYNIEEDKCVLCHKCEKVCPIVSGYQYGTNDLKSSQPFAVWAKEESFRKTATSGGVFPALAQNIIQQGGVVFGALQEQFYVHHEQIDSEEEIVKLQGSKYTQSNTKGVYQQVKHALNEGRKVLFSGVGCQTAALLSFLGEDKNVENLFTVDLICGGVPSNYLIKRFVEEYEDNIGKIVSYRTKSKYELTVEDKNGVNFTMPADSRPLPLYGFTTGATERYSCYDCPFAKGHRMSDITIGDFWGNTLFPEQNGKGVSVAIAHSVKGQDLLNSANLEIQEIKWRDFLFKNPRAVYGKGTIPRSRYHLAKAFNSYDYEKLLEDYANKGSWKRPITKLNRVVRIIKGVVLNKIRQRKVENVLKNNNL